MYLSDIDIKKGVESGEIVLKGFDEKRLQAASYDILLGNKFLITDSHLTPIIDPARKILPQMREVHIEDGEEFVLHPGVSILGFSWDYFGSNHYLIQLSGKSSLARIGLVVHNTAGLINPGHFLNIAFELSNLNNIPIILRPKMEIAQLTFSMLSSPSSKTYDKVGRYHENNWNSFVEKKVG
ncbi:MAG: dCTP deaminase [Candidatus Gracilibacteria bacterium]|nr:dCTP deaminase [Candidatus Gracilibacteria bacterium]